jgi:hypothetical protein
MADKHFSEFDEVTDIEDADIYAVSRGGVSKKVLGSTVKSISSVKSVTVDISTAEMLDLFNNPVTLVPAPGTGKTIVPVHVVLQYVFNTQPFGRNADSVTFFASRLQGYSD